METTVDVFLKSPDVPDTPCGGGWEDHPTRHAMFMTSDQDGLVDALIRAGLACEQEGDLVSTYVTADPAVDGEHPYRTLYDRLDAKWRAIMPAPPDDPKWDRAGMAILVWAWA